MKGQKIGYIRVSSAEQNTDRQLVDVKLEKVFEEKVSAKTANRPQLIQMLGHIRENDEVFVHDISRLARNIEDLHRLVREITDKGCSIHFVKENLHFSGDKADPTQELLMNMLGAVYTFERQILKCRQAEGIAVAKSAGKYKGRPPKIDNDEIKRVLGEGNSISKTAKILDISMSSVQRAKRL